MQLKETIQQLESSKQFQDWKKDNPDSFLAHVFKMIDAPNIDSWQIGYYSKEKDTITTFTITNKEIAINPESEVFKKQETEVLPLDLNKVNLGLKEATTVASNFQKENYKGEEPSKVITILQNISLGQVYNITFLTKTLNTLNMKISAEDKNGKVLKHELIPMMKFGKKIK